MAPKYLDENGLSYFWGKLKALLAGKANVTAVAASASISNTDLITYKNSSGTALFTLQLPAYMLKTDMVAATDSEIDTILAS